MIYEEIESNKRKTLFLFIAFFALIALIGAVFDFVYPTYPGLGLMVSVIITLVWVIISYFTGDKIVLAISGAREAKKREYPHLVNSVEGLSIAAGIPMPRVYVINDVAINAFATGRDPRNASIAVTTGAIEKLNRQELEGVIGHEMSHIKNYDIRTMLFAAVLVGVIAILSDFLIRGFLWGGRRDDDRKDGGLFLVFALVGIVLAVLAPIIANLIKLAISRKREFLADASGALVTRYPQGLADALKKIAKDSHELRNATNATAHLYISNPFKKKGFFVSLFSTHPPIEERIRLLEAM